MRGDWAGDELAPPWPPYRSKARERPPQQGIELPGRVVGIVLGAMVAGFGLAYGGAIAGARLFDGSGVASVALASLGLYSVLFGACRWVVRVHGTGSVRQDFGFAFDRWDPLRAVGYALLAWLGLGVVALALSAINPDFAKSNLEGIDLRRDIPASVALAVMAVVVAPVIEELFFRGLLLRALTTTIGSRPALVVQALLFGVAHAGPTYGLGNVGVVASTAVIGLVLGLIVRRHGRLGPAVCMHAVQNAASLLLVLAVTS